jgi:hypothetical protein
MTFKDCGAPCQGCEEKSRILQNRSQEALDMNYKLENSMKRIEKLDARCDRYQLIIDILLKHITKGGL